MVRRFFCLQLSSISPPVDCSWRMAFRFRHLLGSHRGFYTRGVPYSDVVIRQRTRRTSSRILGCHLIDGSCGDLSLPVHVWPIACHFLPSLYGNLRRVPLALPQIGTDGCV